jgi:uncharacterized protein
MARPVSDIAFTPSVKEVQERLGSRESYAQMEENGGWESTVTPELADFLAERDSFYLGTASAEGQPYIQHRGGPRASSRSSTSGPSGPPTSAATTSTSR